MTAKEEFEISAKSILGECTCGEMYLSRRLTAPDCVWCNYSDMVLEELEKSFDLGKSESEATIENLASRVIELETALQNIADATDGENPADAVFYFAAITALNPNHTIK